MVSTQESKIIPPIVALVGLAGSGKDTAGNHLQDKHGFWHVSASGFLKEEALRQGSQPPFSREQLQAVGDWLMQKHGSGPIARYHIDRYPTVSDIYPGGLVITGLRRIAEIKVVLQAGGELRYIEAPSQTRYARVMNRPNPVSFDEFETRDQIELHGQTAEGENGIFIAGIKALLTSSTQIIDNAGSTTEFIARLDQSLGLPLA